VGAIAIVQSKLDRHDDRKRYPMNRTIWIARHAERQDYADSNWYRNSDRPFDPPLSPRGVRQAKALAERLRKEEIHHIFASPFLRTVETAHAVAEALDLPVKLEPGLGEFLNRYSFPALPQTLSRSQLQERFSRVDLDYESPQSLQYPETWKQASGRMETAIRRLSEQFSGHLLLVGHAASVQGLTEGLIPGKPKLNRALAGLVKLVGNGGEWTLELSGDTAHLDRLGEVSRFELPTTLTRYYRYYRYVYLPASNRGK
jgi:broad specificity phosphatase PhoE